MISEQDKNFIIHPDRNKIHCIPNGVDNSFFKNIECKKKFDKIRANQLVCSYSCASAYTKQLRDKKEKKEWTARKKKVAEELKTNSDHRKELQILVNKFIRLRDKDKGCISCGQSLNTKFDAGHFRSVGSCPELRFNEENIHGQCVYCNQHLHGNLIQYRNHNINIYEHQHA